MVDVDESIERLRATRFKEGNTEAADRAAKNKLDYRYGPHARMMPEKITKKEIQAKLTRIMRSRVTYDEEQGKWKLHGEKNVVMELQDMILLESVRKRGVSKDLANLLNLVTGEDVLSHADEELGMFREIVDASYKKIEQVEGGLEAEKVQEEGD